MGRRARQLPIFRRPEGQPHDSRVPSPWTCPPRGPRRRADGGGSAHSRWAPRGRPLGLGYLHSTMLRGRASAPGRARTRDSARRAALPRASFSGAAHGGAERSRGRQRGMAPRGAPAPPASRSNFCPRTRRLQNGHWAPRTFGRAREAPGLGVPPRPVPGRAFRYFE